MAGETAPIEALDDAPDVEYGPYYFAHGCGIPYERNEHWLEFFGEIADHIVRDLQPSSVLDAGCAKGFLVEALRNRGVEAWGIDISEHAISEVDESVKEFCGVGSVTDPITRRYDLIVSLEVLEHLPPAESEEAVVNLCAATDCLLFSSAPGDFGEPTHLNVMPPEAWSALLAREGFLRDVDRDVSYVTPWAAVYLRRDEPFAESVRRYDRSWSRLHEEARMVRRSLLQAHERLAELEAAAADAEKSQLAPLNEEILRLRDLLISKDRELGTVRGQLAVANDQLTRYVNATRRIHRRLPGAIQFGERVLQKVRRPRA
jgi:SAM-dependent methyltransferase